MCLAVLRRPTIEIISQLSESSRTPDLGQISLNLYRRKEHFWFNMTKNGRRTSRSCARLSSNNVLAETSGRAVTWVRTYPWRRGSNVFAQNAPLHLLRDTLRVPLALPAARISRGAASGAIPSAATALAPSTAAASRAWGNSDRGS